MIRPGTYRHYKGQFYNVIGTAKHSETLEDMIIYQQLYDDYGFWVRPKSIFCQIVTIGNQSMPRFELVSESKPHIAAQTTSSEHFPLQD
jgi:hypothetical protein